MWKRFLIRRRSVMITWLFSYLAILTVPVIISIFVYAQSQSILKSEIHRANNVLLKEVRETIDNYIGNAERLTTELTWNVRIRSFIYSNLYKKPGALDSDLYNLHKTVQEMSIYQSLYPSIKSYYVYWKDQDLILEPGVYRDSRLSYNTIHENETIPYEIWLSIMQKNNLGHFIKLESKDSSASTLAYIHSFPGNKLESPPGATVVLLDTTRLMEAITNVRDFSSGQVMLLNREGQVLLSTQQSNGSKYLTELNSADESGSYFADYDGKPSEFMYIKSKNSELVYATVVPKELFWQKTDYLRKITYAGILVSLLGGLGLTIVFLYRNYSPIQRLLRMLKVTDTRTPAAAGNEYLSIQQAIADTLNEQEQTQLQIKQQSHMLRSNMLERMLRGRQHAQIGLDESLSAFDVHFQSHDFAVLVYHVDYERFSAHLDQFPGVQNHSRLMQFIVTNIVEDLAGSSHHAYISEIDGHMVCLLNFAPGLRDEQQQDVIRLAGQSREFLSEKFNIETLVSISGIHSGMDSISRMYREAVDVMEYMVVVGQQGVAAHDEIYKEEADMQLTYAYSIQTEQQLINVVKAGDAVKAKTMIREIIAGSMEQKNLSMDLFKCLMFNLVSTLVRTIVEVGGTDGEPPVNITDWIAGVMSCEFVKDMEQQLLSVVDEVCSYTISRQKQQQQSSRSIALKQLTTDINAFIEERYDDPNLNISMIGEHFNLTPTYLSKLFKEQTGSGLLDTINQHRLLQAKVLLRNPESNIKAVAGQVGYHDINTFIRTFKKYEGMTPGQYQKML